MPQNFPRTFSFLNLRVREIGEEYTAWSSKFIDAVGKVAVLKELDSTYVMLLANNGHTYVMSKSGNEEWRFLRASAVHDDVIVMGGKFYVVGNQGRYLARVNPIDLSEEIILDSPPTEVLSKKFLVECEGNLLLVENYCYEQGIFLRFPHECEYRIDTIFVFKPDENSRKLVEVNDLGEMILFIGKTCSFSASAKDVFGESSTTTGCKGNCVIIWSEEEVLTRVFELETQRFEKLDSLPAYSKLFWPPPEWAYSASDN